MPGLELVLESRYSSAPPAPVLVPSPREEDRALCTCSEAPRARSSREVTAVELWEIGSGADLKGPGEKIAKVQRRRG